MAVIVQYDHARIAYDFRVHSHSRRTPIQGWKNLGFYRATACNATHRIAIAINYVCPSVSPSDACVVTKLNDGLRIF